jgi:hypothetical protein
VTTPDDPMMSHRSLDAVIASYRQAVEAGQVPNGTRTPTFHGQHASVTEEGDTCACDAGPRCVSYLPLVRTTIHQPANQPRRRDPVQLVQILGPPLLPEGRDAPFLQVADQWLRRSQNEQG